jgi:hypothetical protein
MHHIDDEAMRSLVESCVAHLTPNGRLIIKDVNTRPFLKIAFTWLLDVLVTRGFEMWYRSEQEFRQLLGKHFKRIDTFPISDWLPYPHILYLAEKPRDL